jgi:chloride channel protein, CIC family
MSKTINLVRRPLLYLKRLLTPRQFLIFSASIIGLSAGLVAVILKSLVSFVHHLFIPEKFTATTLAMFIFPFVGILFTVLFTKYLLNGNLGRGLSGILYEISKKSSVVQKHKMFSQVITSAVTVGLGGSSGLEAPIVVTGSAVGSNIALSLHFSYKERTLLLGCGAAAGIAAVFNSPIAGVMFAIEILLTDVSTFMLVPLVIAAACGTLCSSVMLHEDTLFFFKYLQPFDYKNVPFYLVLSVLCGSVSFYYAKMTHFIENFFAQFAHKVYIKAITGGVLLAILYYFFPSLFGEGYGSIKHLAAGQPSLLLQNSFFFHYFSAKTAILLLILALVFVKVIATSITLSSGGNGGNFAPSLFTGAHLGFFFARFINHFFPTTLPESNFTIVGMAGILSGVMYAPLTAVFLIAEITGGYELIVPLMIVSTMSFAMVKHFEPYSMETKKMAKSGDIFTHDKDKNVLLLLQVTDVIEKDIFRVYPEDTLRDLVKVIEKSKRNIFVVTDKQNVFLGIITLDDVREIMFRQDLYSTVNVQSLMKLPPATVSIKDDMNTIMQQFDTSGVWNLPVLDDKQYVGFISKASIFSKYRNQLKNVSQMG